MTLLRLPNEAGGTTKVALHPAQYPDCSRHANWNRTAFAAAHVVTNPLATYSPTLDSAIDWDATLAYRSHLWRHGFGVAEAMDTAQRGAGLTWPDALKLIRETARWAKAEGCPVASGAGTDHLDPGKPWRMEDIIDAYRFQCEAIEQAGSRVILMSSRALAANAKSAEDYFRVYHEVLRSLEHPAILHWLGSAFDPALSGYWGADNQTEATEHCLAVIKENQSNVCGIKISLLDPAIEISLRNRLPAQVQMLTGDDFNYPELIAGDDKGHSGALLGIFDSIAPVASKALSALSEGDKELFHTLLGPTVPLSRHIFCNPTQFYKVGTVFLAYLNGYQSHFTMLGGLESARSTLHLARLIELANNAQLFHDPDLVAYRARAFFTCRGVSV
ncbi:dihydrodipicolinate synthase family protein [Parasalinivibrio latis]|uniref:dihydrodipicolinate synthase family protein n=1 Tax=Parasalinivibrio latis TaxID=2952610 RepID=UPI0030E2D27C